MEYQSNAAACPHLSKLPMWAFVLHWACAASLMGLTGGPQSPLMPYALFTVLVHAAVLGPRSGIVFCVASIAALWAMTLGRASGYLQAACLTPFMAGALWVGACIHRLNARSMWSSVAARDEVLRTHAERQRELSNLQAELAHTLKNPLCSIKGLASLMALDPARSGERLEVLQKEVHRMQHILDDFLTFSRPLTPLLPDRMDARQVVAAAVSLHHGAAAEKGVTLDISGGAPVEMTGDARKVREMLVQLLDNAIDASPEGGSVEVLIRRDGHHVQLAVLDRGPGIDCEQLVRVMEPGVTTKNGGSGLGLTIVRTLAKQHGGMLRLSNRGGGGLVAEIELPIDCPEVVNQQTLA